MAGEKKMAMTIEDYRRFKSEIIDAGITMDFMLPEFADSINKFAFMEGDTGVSRLLEAQLPMHDLYYPDRMPAFGEGEGEGEDEYFFSESDQPYVAPGESVEKVIKGKDPDSVERAIPGHLAPLKDYSEGHIRDVVNMSGVSNVEGFFDAIGIPFTDRYILSRDWGEEAMSHLEISPNSSLYEEYKDKKLVMTDKEKDNIHMYKGEYLESPLDLGFPRGLAKGGRKRYIEKHGTGARNLEFRVANTGKTITIPPEDLVVNQNKFFRQFSGLGVPRREGEIKASGRQELLAGDPSKKYFKVVKDDSGNLIWTPTTPPPEKILTFPNPEYKEFLDNLTQ